MSTLEMMSLGEATHEVEVAITRLALLHLSFSKTTMEELGEQKGEELVLRSIMEYGRRIGERTKRGLQDLPRLGVYRALQDGRIRDCTIARILKEEEEDDLGRLYCYVDPAKTIATNPLEKIVHRACLACGDEYCVIERKATTEKERRDFEQES